MGNMEKDKFISSEITKYKRIFKNISDDKRPFAEKWCKEAAFMNATLRDLQNIINSEGAVTESMNGNGFKVVSEHPAQKSYNVMIRNYNATIKHLIDLLPEEQQKGDELLEFIGADK